MIESSLISTDMLVADLRHLCALPTSRDPNEAQASASYLASLMRQRGLNSEIMATSGAPLVVGRRVGRSPFTLLLYHHYDYQPVGPWRLWNHDPFQLAERDGNLFGRGVADGKGPLAAHLGALAGVLAAEGELPISVIVVADGEATIGSPHLGSTVSQYRDTFRADVCLGTAGERDRHGRPICYNGSKGLLQARLTAIGANQVLPGGLAATVPNPLWRLVWALAAIKSDQEEILIDGFYDEVESPSRAENQAIRSVQLDEAGRLESWGLNRFLFDMTGKTLATAEASLPTCNVSAMTAEPESETAALPVVASARLDFQLVARQRPQVIFDLLRDYLKAKDFLDIDVERLVGGYPASTTPADHGFVEQVRAAGLASYGESLPRLPLGPFSLPLFFFTEAYGIPAAVLGCARNESAIHGSNEHIPLTDLLRHGTMLADLLAQYRQP